MILGGQGRTPRDIEAACNVLLCIGLGFAVIGVALIAVWAGWL